MFPSSENLSSHLSKKPIGPQTTTRAVKGPFIDAADADLSAFVRGTLG